jgi:hypothetical protein
MIIIDYFNFLYCRYPEITEELIKKNLKIIANFFEDKNTYIKIVFDGVRFKDISLNHKKISLIFSERQSADDVIIAIFEKLQGKTHILVSRDRHLGNVIKVKSNSLIVDPLLLWKKLDLFYKHNCFGLVKKSSLQKTTDYIDDSLDDLYKQIK